MHIHFYLLGESGDTFYNLDCGNHTLDVRCSPDGTDQEFDLSTRQFTVRCPSELIQLPNTCRTVFPTVYSISIGFSFKVRNALIKLITAQMALTVSGKNPAINLKLPPFYKLPGLVNISFIT